MSWFPARERVQMVAEPATGEQLAANGAITLTFSRAEADAFLNEAAKTLTYLGCEL